MPAPAPATPAPEVPHERLSALWQQVADALPDVENVGRVAWIAEEIGRPIERLGELTADEVAKIESAFTADAGADQ